MAKRTAREQMVIRNRRMLIYTFLLILVLLYAAAKQETGSAQKGFVLDESDMWCLILTNDRYPASGDDQAERNLQEIPGSSQQVDERVREPLMEMLEDMKDQGLKPVVCSGYRTLDEQELKEAGSGEHSLGLAVDIGSGSCGQLEEAFADTPEGVWLGKHSWEYGFILRYDRGKEEYTGIQYQPWHFRYVGEKAAEYLHRTGMCLEEFYFEESLYG